MLLAESCPEYRATSGGKLGEGPTFWKLLDLVRDEPHTCVGKTGELVFISQVIK